MEIKIGKNNKIKKSIIGSNNKNTNSASKDTPIIEIVIGLIITVVGGVLLSLLLKLLNIS